MEPKKLNEDIAVNDGGGLFDSKGLIDTLIEDCNELPHDLMDGRYVKFCSRIVQMVQKLANLRTGIDNDAKFLQAQVEDLKRLNDELASQIPIEKPIQEVADNVPG